MGLLVGIANVVVAALILVRLRWLVRCIGWRSIVREVTRR